MILTLNEAKAAARVLHNYEDMFIQGCADAAQVWIERVTGKTFDPAPDDIKLVARMMVAHWFDQRHAVGGANFTEVPLGVRTLLATRRSFAHVGTVAPVAP